MSSEYCWQIVTGKTAVFSGVWHELAWQQPVIYGYAGSRAGAERGMRVVQQVQAQWW